MCSSSVQFRLAGQKSNDATSYHPFNQKLLILHFMLETKRYLTAEEANKLINSLKGSQNKMLQYIVPMLILTGARKQEDLKAKWEDFNFERRLWKIPISKSGKVR